MLNKCFSNMSQKIDAALVKTTEIINVLTLFLEHGIN